MKSQEQKNLKSRILNPKSKPRVFVGLSGGVDSAVSAALLKERGYAVTGVFIKAWTPEGYPCTWKEDRRSAMKVAAILDIPFITLDLEKEYKKEVVDYMIDEYKKGRTPNPDVMCNKEIKFGHFLKFALKSGADFVATGHYAVRSPKSDFGLTRSPTSGYQLLEGADKNKDQSYFLWTLTQNQLKHILFPIGHLQKEEVRKIAEKFSLPQATRKDSQGLCFLGKVDMKEFLSRYITSKNGKVLNERGEAIGYHSGALFFTIGERHGFTITKKTTEESPLYVVAKDIKKNTITVAPKIISPGTRKKIANGKVWPSDSEKTREFFQEQFFSGANSVTLNNINLTNEIPSKKLLCRIRYRQEKIKCQITPQKSNQQGEPSLQITFTKPQMSVAPGQSLVLYLPAQAGDSDICLGGGIIENL